MESPEELAGGAVGGATRIGDTVRRSTGPWTPTIHALLDHLNAAGLDGVPRPLGIDGSGREILSYLPGETVGALGPADYPPWAYSDRLLSEVGRWLYRFHAASASFGSEPLEWRSGIRAKGPGEVICHNDLAPYNLVVAPADDGVRLVGVIDWDVAAPGDRLDDLAFVAWTFVPLNHPVPIPDSEAAGRLRLLASAYGEYDATKILSAVPGRMRRAVARISAGAAAGDPGMRRLAATGVVDRVRHKVADLEERLPALTSILAVDFD